MTTDAFDWRAYADWSRFLKSYTPKVRALRPASDPSRSARTATDEGRTAAPRALSGAGSRRR